MKTKVCVWCEQSPRQYPCKTTRSLNSEIEITLKNEKGEYVMHVNECEITVLTGGNKEAKLYQCKQQKPQSKCVVLCRYIRSRLVFNRFIWHSYAGKPEWHYKLIRYWVKRGWLNWK